MNNDLPIFIRPAAVTDTAFVLNSWMAEMHRSSFARYIPDDVFAKGHRALVHALLQNSLCLIACDPANHDHNYGCFCWTPGNPPIAHWAYVKGPMRKLGIGRALLLAAIPDTLNQKTPILCTQANRVFQNEETVLAYNLIYSPYLLLKQPA